MTVVEKMWAKLGCALAILVVSIASAQSLTPALDIHAVVITSEIFKPRAICDENEILASVKKPNSSVALADLRHQLKAENISAYIILTQDEHQSESVSDHDKRLQYISGFSGSNGIAVVTLTSAALWTDSRYFLQALEQLDCNWILMKMGVPDTPTIPEWLSTKLKKGEMVSSDPKICPYEKWLDWKCSLEKHKFGMKVVSDNLIDRIWFEENGRPPTVNNPVFILDVKFAGLTWEEKLTLIREDMTRAGVDTFIFTALDEIAWILNLRGSDIPYFPVFRSYLLVQLNSAILYIHDRKLTPDVLQYLNVNSTCPKDGVRVKPYSAIWDDLPKISKHCHRVGLPSKYSYFTGISYLLYHSICPEKIKLMVSPALIRKNQKNEVEAAGMRAAHVRDGLVVCKFLAQLEEEVTCGSNNWTEIKAVEVLNNLRRMQKYNMGISFGTIAAFGKNAANAHYQPTPATNEVIDRSQLFMLDSGGHYLDGSTDCTRTVHFGTPKYIERDIYTRLLKGCINVASTVFKKGYDMKQLEILIRSPLYEMGLDYGHGSTHGIGHFLAVHEAFNMTYDVNFFGSQEPGYYEPNNFGMRLENIVTVVKAPKIGGNKNFLTFDTVTLIPYERKLINIDLLERKHIIWLNNYHAKVRMLVGNEMKCQGLTKEYEWLKRKTEPIVIPK